MNETPLTYNDVPAALGLIMQKIDAIDRKITSAPREEDLPDTLMTPQQLHGYLDDHPTIATIYTWSCRGRIPSQKQGKALLFSKKEIDIWNATGRPWCEDKKTTAAIDYVNRKRLGK